MRHLEDSHRGPELEKDRQLPGSSGGGPCVSPGDLRVTGGRGDWGSRGLRGRSALAVWVIRVGGLVNTGNGICRLWVCL